MTHVIYLGIDNLLLQTLFQYRNVLSCHFSLLLRNMLGMSIHVSAFQAKPDTGCSPRALGIHTVWQRLPALTVSQPSLISHLYLWRAICSAGLFPRLQKGNVRGHESISPAVAGKSLCLTVWWTEDEDDSGGRELRVHYFAKVLLFCVAKHWDQWWSYNLMSFPSTILSQKWLKIVEWSIHLCSLVLT